MKAIMADYISYTAGVLAVDGGEAGEGVVFLLDMAMSRLATASAASMSRTAAARATSACELRPEVI